MRNLGLKLFSLAIAIILFAFVNSDANTTVTELLLPIELRNLPEDRILIAPLGRQARVTVRGPSSLVARLAGSPPPVKVSLPDDVGLRFSATLREDSLSLPSYVQVQKIEPQEIEFTFDRLVTKEVQVNVPRIGNVPEPNSLESFSVAPAKVYLKGPESELAKVGEVDTYPLDLRDIEKDVNRELALRPQGVLTEATPSSVKVSAKVSAIKQTKSFEKFPVEIRSTESGRYSASPETVYVEVVGSPLALKNLAPEKIVPFVRVKLSKGEKGTYPVQIDLPDGLAVSKVEPAEVQVSEGEEAVLARQKGKTVK